MRTLRYWLGLPLYNLLLWLAYILICYNDMLRIGEDAQLDVIAYLFLSTLVCPLLTALYYPVRRDDCRPLYAVVLKSGAVIFAVCFLTLLVINLWDFSIYTIGSIALLSLILAAREMVGYGIGLVLADRVADAKDRRSVRG